MGSIVVAERLIFRKPKHFLEIKLKPSKNSFIPGDQVEIDVETSVNGKPVAAVIGLTVTDDAVRKVI